MNEAQAIRLRPVETELKAALLEEFGRDKISVNVLGGFDTCRWISINMVLSVDSEDDRHLKVFCWMADPRPILGTPDGPYYTEWLRIIVKRGTSAYDLIRPVAEFLRRYTEAHEETFPFFCS